MTAAPPPHIPVLLSEVIESLDPQDGETFIDGTFGAGGYTRAILEAAFTHVIAIDRDPDAFPRAVPLMAEFGERFLFRPGCFGDIEAIAAVAGWELVDGVVLDIGVSSIQIDEAERGFSFQSDGPLDMRMSRSGESAADVVNTYAEEQLADVIYQLGEDRKSRAIARAIVRQRNEQPFARTSELAQCVSRVFHGRKIDGRHPATRTFQALRIHVNDELGELARALLAAEKILKPGGRLVVVTFHSLEDRIVKRFFTNRAGKKSRGSRHLPETPVKLSAPSFRILNSRPLTPQKGELDLNPRARSARLRAAIRTDAPPMAGDASDLSVPDPLD